MVLILIIIFFFIKDTKLYAPVVTLPVRDNQKLSKRVSIRFERSVHWNEYKTENENKNMTNEGRYFLIKRVCVNLLKRR